MHIPPLRPSWPLICGGQCKRVMIAAAIITVVLSGQAWADEYLQPIGGPGGGPFQGHCPGSEMLAGFELRAADDVDALRPLCVTAYGPRATSAASYSDFHGGGGGRPTNVICPRHTPIVTGMHVSAEGVDTVIVNNIHLFCGLAADKPETGGFPTAIFDAPAYRNNEVFPGRFTAIASDTQHCHAGQVAVGVHGRSGIWLDAIGLICAPPRLAVKSIGRINTGTPSPTRPPGWTICDSARDARARNSPAAPNLEAQCEASKTIVTSIGRVNTGTPSPPGPPMSICDRARDARARNSPAAPNLEAQCRAAGGP